MSKYKYQSIDDVLGTSFSWGSEQTYDEAISGLKHSVAQSPSFANDILQALHQAFRDPSYSWLEVFEEHEVSYFDGVEMTEKEARDNALSLFIQIDPTLQKYA